MKGPPYRDRDYVFGQAMLALRTTIRLTQVELAKHLGVSRKAVGEWEGGITYPKAEYLKEFIALAVGHRAFPAGREAEEIRAFWHAAHQKVPLDEVWFAALLPSVKPFPISSTTRESFDAAQTLAPLADEPRVDWGDALAITTFYGREWELNLLNSWVVEERCRVVSVLGLGGIGKSVLAVRLMHQVADQFDVVIWRSLRDAPAFDVLLNQCLQILVPQAIRDVSIGLEQRLSFLMDCLRRTRVLLVLDNLETILEGVQRTGHMRSGYEGYARLLRQMAETRHQSCLLLTSREKPIDLVPHEGSLAPVRVLRLARLETSACQQLLAEKGVTGTSSKQAQLIERYAGNPLALKIVVQTIVDLFDGEIVPFLEQDEVVFGGVRELLDEQYVRLADLERTVLHWLSIMREPITHNELRSMLVIPVPAGELLEAVEALRRRNLIERGQRPGSFTLQSVVLEYVTSRLIAEVVSEIKHSQPARLIEHGLELATVKEYVRQTQQRVLVDPLLAQVRMLYSERVAVEEHLLALLDKLRKLADYAQGYGPANLLALLREQRGHLRGLDLSHLAIRGASLQGVEMQDTSLADANLRETVFNEAFDITWAVAISSNGQYWAAGSKRGEVRIWREEGKLLQLAWQAHTDTVRTLAFSPDARTLATGSWDGTIKLWDRESGTLLWTSWFTDNIESLAFASDGLTLASGGDDATVRLWDTHSGAHLQTISDQSGPVFALVWSPDGSLLASGGVDRVIRLWKNPHAQPDTPTTGDSSVRIFAGHTNWVLGLAFSPDGTQLASASWDGTVKLWDVGSGNLRQTLTGHTDRVRVVAWSPDGHLLASCGFDQTIWLWDSDQGSYRTGLYGHTAGVYDIAFTSDSRGLLSSSEDGTLRLWDVERGQCVRIMQGYAVSLYDVAWSPDGTQLASAGSNTLVTIWDVEGVTPPRLLHGHRSLVYGVAWSPDGELLVSSGWDNAIRLWQATTGEIRQILRDPDHINTLFYDVTWSPDGTRIASGSYHLGVQVWEATTGIRQWMARGQQTRVRRVAWSPDGTHIASSGDDGSVCLWEAANGTLRTSLKGHRGMVMSIAWSPDGTQLASGGGNRGNGELIIWDVSSGERLHAWSETGAVVYALAWSSTEGWLLSGDSDGSIRWWDTRSKQCLKEQKGHQGAVQSLSISPDGRRLASVGDDNTIHVWNIQSSGLQRTLHHDRPCERMNIIRVKGLTEAQKATLRTLGAIESDSVADIQ